MRRMVSVRKENDHMVLEWPKAMATAFAAVENPGMHLTVPGAGTLALLLYGEPEPVGPSGGGQEHPAA